MFGFGEDWLGEKGMNLDLVIWIVWLLGSCVYVELWMLRILFGLVRRLGWGFLYMVCVVIERGVYLVIGFRGWILK